MWTRSFMNLALWGVDGLITCATRTGVRSTPSSAHTSRTYEAALTCEDNIAWCADDSAQDLRARACGTPAMASHSTSVAVAGPNPTTGMYRVVSAATDQMVPLSNVARVSEPMSDACWVLAAGCCLLAAGCCG